MSGKKVPYADFKNYQVYQEVCLIGLLNTVAGITISLKRRKLEREILTFFHVDEIIIKDEQIIECEKTVNDKCETLKMYELRNGLSLQTAERRYHKNRIIETLHMLIDILELYGVTFQTYMTSGKNGAIRQETIRAIILPNGTMLSIQDIKEIGSRIYSELFKRVKPTSESTIPVRDISIQDILLEMCGKQQNEISCVETSHLVNGHLSQDQMEEVSLLKKDDQLLNKSTVEI